jgi:hypothetical protein
MPAQKPAAHRCRRVFGETIHFEENTMVDRTGQVVFDFFIHKWRSLRLAMAAQAILRAGLGRHLVSETPFSIVGAHDREPRPKGGWPGVLK